MKLQSSVAAAIHIILLVAHRSAIVCRYPQLRTGDIIVAKFYSRHTLLINSIDVQCLR